MKERFAALSDAVISSAIYKDYTYLDKYNASYNGVKVGVRISDHPQSFRGGKISKFRAKQWLLLDSTESGVDVKTKIQSFFEAHK